MAVAIDAARRDLTDAFARGDVTALAVMLTAEALWVVPGRPPLSSRDQIVAMFADAFAGSTYRLRLDSDQLMVGPSWTAEHGAFESAIVDDAGRSSPPHVGRYLLVWRSCQDGWLIDVYADVTAPGGSRT